MEPQTAKTAAYALGSAVFLALLFLPSGAGAQAFCVDFEYAHLYAGEAACIAGTVSRVVTLRSGISYLYFCREDKSCPLVAVAAKGVKASGLRGRTLEMFGRIRASGERSLINLASPRQFAAD